MPIIIAFDSFSECISIIIIAILHAAILPIPKPTYPSMGTYVMQKYIRKNVANCLNPVFAVLGIIVLFYLL